MPLQNGKSHCLAERSIYTFFAIYWQICVQHVFQYLFVLECCQSSVNNDLTASKSIIDHNSFSNNTYEEALPVFLDKDHMKNVVVVRHIKTETTLVCPDHTMQGKVISLRINFAYYHLIFLMCLLKNGFDLYQYKVRVTR